MRRLVVIAGIAAVLTAWGGGPKSPSSTLSAKATITNTTAATAHTYVLADSAGENIYVTIVSPVAIPTHLMTQSGAKIVAHAHGPQVCSFTKTVHNPTSSSAFLDGKTVALKINGSTPTVSALCTLLKKAPFDANRLGEA